MKSFLFLMILPSLSYSIDLRYQDGPLIIKDPYRSISSKETKKEIEKQKECKKNNNKKDC